MTSGAASEIPPLIVIQPPRGWIPVNWGELWRYRSLLYFLTWRDIKVRYKQTVLGALWAAIQPLMIMVVFTVFFGRLAKIPSDDLPYPIFVYAGLLPWTFLSNAVNQSGISLVNSAHVITKVYFPRLLVPTASVAGVLVDLLISFIVFACIMAYYGFTPPLLAVITPALIALTVMTALGVGYWLSALTVAYRDFRYVVPFGLQVWMFCSPVIYPVSFVPEKWGWLLAMNPMTGVIGGFRAALLDRPMHWDHLAVSAGIGVALFLSGLLYFRRVERRFADIA